MRAALLAEYRKVVSTRMWWILLIVMAAYLGFVAGFVALSLVAPEAAGSPNGAPASALTGPDAASAVYALVNTVGYVFPLVIGSLAVTTEFRYQTITPSLLAEPSRTRLLVGKLAVMLPTGLLYGVVGSVATVGVAAPVLAILGDGAFLGEGEVIGGVLLGILVTGLWAVIGVGFGSLVPNQVAAIVVILTVTQFVEPIARIALAAFDPVSGLAKYLPASAADAVIGASVFDAFGGGGEELLSRPGGLLVMVAYAVVFAVLGRLVTLRRDIG